MPTFRFGATDDWGAQSGTLLRRVGHCRLSSRRKRNSLCEWQIPAESTTRFASLSTQPSESPAVSTTRQLSSPHTPALIGGSWSATFSEEDVSGSISISNEQVLSSSSTV
jgi:hypothetical protein